jgi:hypothetical protein
LAAILKMADILKILKMQNCSSNGDLSLCQILCLYHYPVRSYSTESDMPWSITVIVVMSRRVMGIKILTSCRWFNVLRKEIKMFFFILRGIWQYLKII